METLWHHLGKEEVLDKLKTTHHGLVAGEATRRLQHYGRNELPTEKPLASFQLILRQLKGPLVAILFIAAAISFALQDFLDANVILVAVVLNVVVGFFQERRAERALTQLRRVVRFEALVIRNGEEVLVPAETLVPGDIITLTTGSRIPADARLLQAVDLTVNEASLTGESFPVPKGTKRLEGNVGLPERRNMVFLGTTIAQGTGMAVVTATGLETELGTIAKLLHDTPDDPTPLQQRLHSFSRFLGTVIVAVALGLFLVGILVQKPLTEIFTVAVAVAVAAIPEGLLVAVTVILAVGMQRILKQKALVRQLIAAETLGSTTVICTDKTGTLTEGIMSVVRIVTESADLGLDATPNPALEKGEQSPSAFFALEIGMLCNDAHIEHEAQPLEHRVVTGNPTERALVFAAHAAGLTRHALGKEYPRLDTIPFDSEKKYMVTLHRPPHGDALLLMKGAPERVLDVCTEFDKDGEHHKLTDARRAELIHASEKMSLQGLRVLAIAHRHIDRTVTSLASLSSPTADMVFVALIGMKDPLRKTAKETVRLCRSAGIRMVMITGDHKLTARTIAEEIGLPAKAENVISGEELAVLSDYELEQRIRDIHVYARVTPKDKIRIVDAWQAKGEVVAMTGDGVNDAPALKSANIGIALGSGTDVAKEAADVVLLDDNFRTIVAAVEQGRVIYENIRKVVLYLLTDSFSEVIIVAVSLLVGIVTDFPLPLAAAQILWINLVTDGLPNIALTVEPEEAEIMQEPPRNPREAFMTKEMKWLIATVSFVSAAAAFFLFWWYWHGTGDLTLARTVAFTALGVDSLLYVFSIRNLRHSLFRFSPFSNRPLLFAVLGGFIIQIFAIYFAPLQRILGTTALGTIEWLWVALAVFLVMASVEIVKAVFRQQRKHYVA